MRVLMIHPHDLYTEPWTIRIIKIAESLVRKGCRVTLCYFPYRQRREQGYIIRENLPIGPDYIALDRSRAGLFANIRKIDSIARRADVVHVQKCFANAALPALFAARRHRLPLHYDWDDDESGIARYGAQFLLSRWKITLYETVMPKLATTVSVASEVLFRKARDLGVPGDRIVDAPVGADLHEFDDLMKRECTIYPRDRSIRHWILYVGQLEGANYASILISSFGDIVKKRPDVGLMVVGGGFGKTALEKQVAELNVQDNVVMTGYVRHELIPSILARADIAVACLADTRNARAKSPLKVVEYLAAGCAVVGSAVGEIKRMIEGCGVLVPPDDATALTDAIINLLDHPDMILKLKQKSRERAASCYTWDRSADNIFRMYEAGIASK